MTQSRTGETHYEAQFTAAGPDPEFPSLPQPPRFSTPVSPAAVLSALAGSFGRPHGAEPPDGDERRRQRARLTAGHDRRRLQRRDDRVREWHPYHHADQWRAGHHQEPGHRGPGGESTDH